MGDPSGSSSGLGRRRRRWRSRPATFGTETSGSILSPSDVNGARRREADPRPGQPRRHHPAGRGLRHRRPDDAHRRRRRGAADRRRRHRRRATRRRRPHRSTRPTTLKALARRIAQGRAARLQLDAFSGSGARASCSRRRSPTSSGSARRSSRPTSSRTAATPALAELGLIPNDFKANLNHYLTTEIPTPKSGVKSLADIIAFNDKHPDKVKYGQNLLQASDAMPGRPTARSAGSLGAAHGDGRRHRRRARQGRASTRSSRPVRRTPTSVPSAGYPTVIVPAGLVSETTADGHRPSSARPGARRSCCASRRRTRRARTGACRRPSSTTTSSRTADRLPQDRDHAVHVVAVDRIAAEREQRPDPPARLRVPAEGQQAGVVHAVDERLRPAAAAHVDRVDAAGRSCSAVRATASAAAGPLRPPAGRSGPRTRQASGPWTPPHSHSRAGRARPARATSTTACADCPSFRSSERSKSVPHPSYRSASVGSPRQLVAPRRCARSAGGGPRRRDAGPVRRPRSSRRRSRCRSRPSPAPAGTRASCSRGACALAPRCANPSRRRSWRGSLPSPHRMDMPPQPRSPNLTGVVDFGGNAVTRLARFVLQHRALIAVFWLILLVAGGATSAKTVDRLTVDFSLPGQPGYETEKQIVATYGNGPDEGSSIVTVTVPAGSTVAAEKAKVDGVFAAVAKGLPGFRVISPANSDDPRFVTKDGRTAYGIVVEKKFFSFAQKPSFTLVKPVLAEQREGDRARHRHHGLLRAVGRRHRRHERAEPAGRDAARRAGRAARPDLRLRLVPRTGADGRGDGVDPVDVPVRARGHLRHRRQLRRAVPHRAGRPGRRDRLLAAHRQPMAGGASARPGEPRRRRRGRADRRPHRPGLGRHRGHLAARADRGAGAAAAQHGHRWPAHPAGEHGGRA